MSVSLLLRPTASESLSNCDPFVASRGIGSVAGCPHPSSAPKSLATGEAPARRAGMPLPGATRWKSTVCWSGEPWVSRHIRKTPRPTALFSDTYRGFVKGRIAQKTPRVRRWFVRHPRFYVHFTPTSASWLNLVERWFALLSQKQIKTRHASERPRTRDGDPRILDDHQRGPEAVRMDENC